MLAVYSAMLRSKVLQKAKYYNKLKSLLQSGKWVKKNQTKTQSLVQSLSIVLCKHSVTYELKKIFPKGRSFTDTRSCLIESK